MIFPHIFPLILLIFLTNSINSLSESEKKGIVANLQSRLDILEETHSDQDYKSVFDENLQISTKYGDRRLFNRNQVFEILKYRLNGNGMNFEIREDSRGVLSFPLNQNTEVEAENKGGRYLITKFK
ncbi:unnamed protein product [Caenorhabditis angaria]|uniref:Uncharacterized protein n=1 Tax=Caenorhabditis angaria TaxID=860376 RepID=A0A9P1MXF0_9PELO|nr:unnamed protein product [Caenorhabditis angaria]